MESYLFSEVQRLRAELAAKGAENAENLVPQVGKDGANAVIHGNAENNLMGEAARQVWKGGAKGTTRPNSGKGGFKGLSPLCSAWSEAFSDKTHRAHQNIVSSISALILRSMDSSQQ